MNNILNLFGYTITNIKETEYDYLFQAELTSPPLFCPYGACGGSDFVRYGSKPQLFRDLNMHGKRVGIEVMQKRFKCKKCSRTFREEPMHMDEKRYMTKRLLKYIEEQSLKRTFVSIAEEIGLLEKTIRDIFKDYVVRLEKEFIFKIPEWLGIDEIHILKQPRCVITNVKECTMIDLLKDRNKTTVVNYLMRLENRKQVKYICMDMWNPYRDAARAVLPHAQIVVDKFHVVRMANQAVEIIRKDLREGLTKQQRRGLMHDRFVLLKRRKDLSDREHMLLDVWTKNYPELCVAYELKEQLYELWDSQSISEAKAKYQQWFNAIPDCIQYAFDPLTTAVKNWEKEIFAYFENPVTNAYTESLNSLIRIVDRLGRGYSFDVLRAKVLYSNGAHRVEKPRFDISNFNREIYDDDDMLTWVSDNYGDYITPDNFGVDISTLWKKITSGDFD